MSLAQRETKVERLLGYKITFAGASGADFDVTDGELVRAIQRGEIPAVGTRVRVAHYDDTRSWYEVVEVVDARPAQLAAAV